MQETRRLSRECSRTECLEPSIKHGVSFNNDVARGPSKNLGCGTLRSCIFLRNRFLSFDPLCRGRGWRWCKLFSRPLVFAVSLHALSLVFFVYALAFFLQSIVPVESIRPLQGHCAAMWQMVASWNEFICFSRKSYLGMTASSKPPLFVDNDTQAQLLHKFTQRGHLWAS